jgi:hypothetical protein
MRKQSSMRPGSLMLAFLSSVSLACAQIAPGSETPTGDVWRSDAEYVHWPMSADAEAEEEPSWDISSPTNTEVLHADCTVRSQSERRRHVSTARAASLSDRRRENLRLVRVAGRLHTLRRGLPQDARLLSFRCRIDAPSSEIGRAP